MKRSTAQSAAKPAAIQSNAFIQLKASAISGSTQKIATPIRMPPLKGTRRFDQACSDVSQTPAVALRYAIPVMKIGR